MIGGLMATGYCTICCDNGLNIILPAYRMFGAAGEIENCMVVHTTEQDQTKEGVDTHHYDAQIISPL